MNLELELFYRKCISMPMSEAESITNFNSSKIRVYCLSHDMYKILECYYKIEKCDNILKERYKHLFTILHHYGTESETLVLSHLILFGNLEDSLKRINDEIYRYEITKDKIMNYQMNMYIMFNIINKYFNKEFEEYINKYIDIINGVNSNVFSLMDKNDPKKIFEKMGINSVFIFIALCSSLYFNENSDEESKYINAIIKALDCMPNKFDNLIAFELVIDKNELLRNKFLEILNNDESLIIYINYEFGNYFFIKANGYLYEKEMNKFKLIDEYYNNMKFPNYFSFIAKHFHSYFYVQDLFYFKELYLNDKESFYKLYNLLKIYNSCFMNKHKKIMFVLFSAILLENNDNNFDLEAFKLAYKTVEESINSSLINSRYTNKDLISYENIDSADIFNKDKNNCFDDLLEYFSNKNTIELFYWHRKNYPGTIFNTDIFYAFALFNFGDLCSELRSSKKLCIDLLKYLPLEIGIRIYIETQYGIRQKTFREIIESLINNKELNITLTDILFSYYYEYESYFYYGEVSLYNKLIDEKGNIRSFIDLLIENFKEELKYVLDDLKSKTNILNDLHYKKGLLDIFEWAYNSSFHYDNFELVYALLETTKSQDIKRACLKIISNNENKTREYVEQAVNKIRSNVLKGNLKTVLKNWNLKKYGDKFNNEEEAIEFINIYYNVNYEKSIKFLENINLNKVLYKNGNEADERIFKYILIEYMNTTEAERLKDCDMLADFLESNSLENALNDVYIYWANNNYDNKEKNILIPYCVYSSNSKIDHIYSLIKDFAKNTRTALAAFIIKCIALNGKNYALVLIDNLTRKSTTAKVKKTAVETMKDIAELLGISPDELSDRIIPNFDFDRKGHRILNYGGASQRTFTLSIDSNLELIIKDDEKNKIIKSLPALNNNDDKETANAIKKEFTSLKKEIKTLVQSQKIRLQKVLMNGRKWDYESFKNVFVNNAVMNIFALKLIWGVYDDNDKLIESFRYMEDGTFNTVDEEEYKLENLNKKNISLVHPLELDEDTINKWKQQLSDYEISQPIEQLEFKHEEIKEECINNDELICFNEMKVKAGVLMSFANKYDLIRGDTGDGGSYTEYIFRDTYLNVSAYINFDYMYFGVEVDDDIPLNNIVFYDESNEYKPVKINPLKVNKRFANSVYNIIKNNI